MLAYALRLTSAVVLLASRAIWKATARLSHSAARWALRAVGVALLVALLPRFLVPWFASHLDRGGFVCAKCGRSIDRLEWLGVPVWTKPGRDEHGVGPTSDSYSTSFADEVGADHAHEWLAVGCHSWGLGVQCIMLTRCTWFTDLPCVGDQELARVYVRRLCNASQSVQYEILRSYERACMESDDPDTRFRDWSAAWSTRYPDGR